MKTKKEQILELQAEVDKWSSRTIDMQNKYSDLQDKHIKLQNEHLELLNHSQYILDKTVDIIPTNKKNVVLTNRKNIIRFIPLFGFWYEWNCRKPDLLMLLYHFITGAIICVPPLTFLFIKILTP